MRTIRSVVLVLVALALSVGVAAAQSLAEVAKKEKKRREANQAESKTVITDHELSRGYGGLPTTRATTTATAAGEDTEEGATADAGEDEEQQEQDETKTPEYWRNRVTAAKDKIARAEEELSQNDWGEGQAVGVDPRGANNLARRQQAEQQLQAARAELEAIRAEARRAGVPPGWVR